MNDNVILFSKLEIFRENKLDVIQSQLNTVISRNS